MKQKAGPVARVELVPCQFLDLIPNSEKEKPMSLYLLKSPIAISTGYGTRTDTDTKETVFPSAGSPTTEVTETQGVWVSEYLGHQSHGSNTPNLPLLELLRRDEASSKVGVPHSLGLPPGGVVLAHHLQDLPPLEGQACLLAGDGTVLPRVIVEEGTHEHL